MYRAEVRFAPAHELVVSLSAYLNRKGRKTLDLGPAWAGQVRDQLSPDFAAELAELKESLPPLEIHLLIEQCPGESDPDSFLRWFAALSPGEIYERLEPYRSPGDPPLHTDLGWYRNYLVAVLTRWNEQYFRKVDPAILAGLAAEAAALRDRAAATSATELVEGATNGILLDPECGAEKVVLIPQYHVRPGNVVRLFRGTGLILYPADQLVFSQGDILPQLMRVVRALSDESRLRILRFLNQEPRTFTDVVKFTGLALSTVHHHLITLRAAGLIRAHEGGGGPRAALYSFRPAALHELAPRMLAYIQQD